MIRKIVQKVQSFLRNVFTLQAWLTIYKSVADLWKVVSSRVRKHGPFFSRAPEDVEVDYKSFVNALSKVDVEINLGSKAGWVEANKAVALLRHYTGQLLDLRSAPHVNIGMASVLCRDIYDLISRLRFRPQDCEDPIKIEGEVVAGKLVNLLDDIRFYLRRFSSHGGNLAREARRLIETSFFMHIVDLSTFASNHFLKSTEAHLGTSHVNAMIRTLHSRLRLQLKEEEVARFYSEHGVC